MEKISIDEFLQQDRHTFDQDKEKWWRSLITNYTQEDYLSRKDEIWGIFQKQNKEAIQLILDYYNKHKDKLSQDQSLLLLRHAGQWYAIDWNYEDAVELFKKVYQIEKKLTNDHGVWLQYIEATIAFLSNDWEWLKQIATTMDKRLINYDVVQRLYLWYKQDKNYFESYSGL